jgi:AGCS family alanine or glycine:cation symporter
MTKVLHQINAFIWGVPTLILILGTGIFLSFATRFIQFTAFPKACKNFFGKFFRKDSAKDGVSSSQALCTALAATVGTGNIAGVAGAISIGGPGAIFWMWICGFLGMAIKFGEATLAVRYRIKGDDGEYHGGPMYMIRRGLGKRFHWLAWLYSFFGVVAAFGVGNATQVNAVISSVDQMLARGGIAVTQKENLLMGIAIAILVVWMLLGGARRIGSAAERLVPLRRLYIYSLVWASLPCGGR